MWQCILCHIIVNDTHEMFMQYFQPCWWLPTGHMQTWAAFLLKRPIYPTSLESLLLADGDVLELHWLHVDNPDAPILLLLHGLEGSVQSNYIQGMLHIAKLNHWRAVVMHFRGCQGRINTIAQSYHAGKTDDLAFALNYIHQTFPAAKGFFAVGYSLGGNVLLKFLGENPQQKMINKAVTISLPFDLKATTHFLQQGIRKYYEYRFLRTLKHSVACKIALGMNMPVNLNQLNKIHTLYDFDNQVTAPLHFFKDANDYYKSSSCKQFLSAINTPTLIIHAVDDPFVPAEVIPQQKEVSKQVNLAVQKHGGHVGFISSGKDVGIRYWLDTSILEYLMANR